MKSTKRIVVILLVPILFAIHGSSIAQASGYGVGYGSSNPATFINAYNRIGGSGAIGSPINAVHVWGGGCIQDFTGGWSGKSGIMQAGCTGTAYYVVYKQWAYLEGRWGGSATSVIGYPTGDDFRWGAGWSQHFAGGSQNNTTLARADQTGIVRSVRGDTRNFWINSKGGAAGSLGYPISEEYPWSGIYKQDFQGGSIIWDPINKARLYSPPAVVALREQKAANWVIAEKNSAYPAWSDEFARPWSGYCEGFVEVAFGTRGRFTSATAHYQWQLAQGRIKTNTNPPVGAVVFYGGGGDGHVGVSIGSGQVISTQGYNGQVLPVWQHGVTGLTVPYLGWAYAPSHWLGR